MKLTIIVDDGLVIIDGHALAMDLSDYTTLDGIHAVQWDGDLGHIEYKSKSNAVIDGIADFQPILNAFSAKQALEGSPPSLTFEQEYQKKYSQIYRVRDSFVYPVEGIEYLGTIFDLDEKSYLNLTQVCASVTLLGRLPESFAWINKANQPITMTLEQFKGLVDVATARFQQGYADALAKKTALALCTTIADIQALQ